MRRMRRMRRMTNGEGRKRLVVVVVVVVFDRVRKPAGGVFRRMHDNARFLFVSLDDTALCVLSARRRSRWRVWWRHAVVALHRHPTVGRMKKRLAGHLLRLL